MGIVSVPSFGSDPATITAPGLDGKVDPLVSEFNGSIENVNIAAGAAISASKIDLSSIAQDIAMSNSQILWAKGADVASGTSIALGTDGNCFDITGTTTIQTITAKQAGSVVLLHFDGALTLTDDTGNLELQGNDLNVNAEDEVILKSDGTNWHLVSHSSSSRHIIVESASAPSTATNQGALYTKNSGTQTELYFREESDGNEVQLTKDGASIGKIAQMLITEESAVSADTQTSGLSNLMKLDDTIPQNTEGTEYMTLAITPINASSTLIIESTVLCSANAGGVAIVALFVDSTANALAAVSEDGSNDESRTVKLVHNLTAGSTSSRTYKIRAGQIANGTFTFNGNQETRLYGGVAASTLKITEVLP